VYERVESHTKIGGEYYLFQLASGNHIRVTGTTGCWCARTLPDGKAVDRILDPYLARGDKVLIDTSSEAVLDLQTRYPNRFVIQEDRDFQSIVDNPSGRFQLIVSLAGSSVNTGQALLSLAEPKDAWRAIARVGGFTVWRYDPVAAPQGAS
jgi:hypothetical protein